MIASVIVPAHDAEATLPRTLAALATQQVDGEFEVIVVDDGSRDATGEVARRMGARVIRHDTPVGPGRSRDRGAAAAAADVLAFVDADCAPLPGWLAAGLQALDGRGLVQGRVEPRPDVHRGPFDRTLWVTRASGLFESANLFVRRDVFDRLSGFGDGLLPLAGAHFGEDVMFGWQARRAGVATGFADEALVHHEVFPRDTAEFVREGRRTGLFAALVREVPELRDTFLYRRYFLSRRSAAFALLAGGLGAAAIARRPWVAGLAALPYAKVAFGDARAMGPRVAAVRSVRDTVGFLSAAAGSAAARRLVL